MPVDNSVEMWIVHIFSTDLSQTDVNEFLRFLRLYVVALSYHVGRCVKFNVWVCAIFLTAFVCFWRRIALCKRNPLITMKSHSIVGSSGEVEMSGAFKTANKDP